MKKLLVLESEQPLRFSSFSEYSDELNSLSKLFITIFNESRLFDIDLEHIVFIIDNNSIYVTWIRL